MVMPEETKSTSKVEMGIDVYDKDGNLVHDGGWTEVKG